MLSVATEMYVSVSGNTLANTRLINVHSNLINQAVGLTSGSGLSMNTEHGCVKAE